MSRLPQVLLALLLFGCATTHAQSFQLVFPNLGGQVLLDSVANHYRANVVLDYANARDSLYSKVLAVDDDTLRCIYSGHALYLDPAQDPTQYVYQNGGTNGINTEHIYPQAKGSNDGNARSDMHNLFPTRILVNEARGDLPFGEIPDNETQKWFYKNQVTTSIPTSNKDAYTEFKTGLFEPRESVKGDIARTMLYFYNIYTQQALAADPLFFELQRATLCQWQAQDPADEAELLKTWGIAAYQENKPNPFVLDCTLAFRTYCPEVAPNCTIGSYELAAGPTLGLRVVPQPFSNTAQVEMELPFAGAIQGFVRSATGQELARFQQEDVPSGTFHWPLVLETSVPVAIGFLEIHLMGKNGQRVSKVVPLVSVKE